MTTIGEASGAKTQLAAGLATGVEVLSLDQQITFTKYVKVVLPIDGFVFWVRADLVGPSALYDAARYDAFAFNQGVKITPAATLVATGSLHVATSRQQDETSTVAV